MTAFQAIAKVGAAARDALRRTALAVFRPIAVFVKDAGQGLLEVCHNSLALLGLGVVAASLFLAGRPELRETLELRALGWLQVRQDLRTEADPNVTVALAEPGAIERVTAADPSSLTRQQAAIAQWLSRRYRVAPEPVSRLVQEAWEAGRRAKLDPTLILAVIAIESRFNPFAQSPVGAQGLMQVMTRVHDEKYENFGGSLAALDPLANLRVGVQILKEAIDRTGSIEGGLKHYVGAANLPTDGGYALKVLSEQSHLLRISGGRQLTLLAPQAEALPLPSIPADDSPGTRPEPAEGPVGVEGTPSPLGRDLAVPDTRSLSLWRPAPAASAAELRQLASSR